MSPSGTNSIPIRATEKPLGDASVCRGAQSQGEPKTPEAASPRLHSLYATGPAIAIEDRREIIAPAAATGDAPLLTLPATRDNGDHDLRSGTGLTAS